MSGAYPSGYLSYGSLPSFARTKPCRYCEQPTVARNGRDAICESRECREKLAALQRETKRRCEERRRRRLARGAK